MDQGISDFTKRYERIRAKHRRLSQGYVTRLNRNGVIEHLPKREVSGSLLTPVAILVAAFFGFKILVLAHLGAEDYASHIGALSQGNAAERVGAVLLTPDPLTLAVVGALPADL